MAPQEGRARILDQTTNDNKLEKVYFKLLQAIHHSEIIAETKRTGKFPVGMSRHTTKLTAFIKPSSPSETTQEKVKQNTHQWMQTNMLILEEHYDGIIATILQDLPPHDPQALQKAIAYGRIRYRHKLTPSSITTLSALTQNTPNVELQQQSALEEERSLEEWPALGGPMYPSGDARSCLAASGRPLGLSQRIPRTRTPRTPTLTRTSDPNHSPSTSNP